MTQAPTLTIDFVGDVVCPWCALGWSRLKRALAARPDLDAEVIWRPFQLRPDAPLEGVPREQVMAQIMPDPKIRRERAEGMIAMFAAEGVEVKLHDIPLSPNTNAAQRLIRWAQDEGRGEVAVEAVMGAYFKDLRDIGDVDVLARIAEEIGMDGPAVKARLIAGEDVEQIGAEHRAAAEAGVTGVPFMIFGGKLAVSGAESAEHLGMAIDQALA